MRVSRLETQSMDFAFELMDINREPMKIIGEELERVTHFKMPRDETEEESCVGTEITVRMGPGWRNWKNCRQCRVSLYGRSGICRGPRALGAPRTREKKNCARVNCGIASWITSVGIYEPS